MYMGLGRFEIEIEFGRFRGIGVEHWEWGLVGLWVLVVLPISLSRKIIFFSMTLHPKRSINATHFHSLVVNSLYKK